MGASIVEGGIDAVNWGGFDGWRPVGVFGTLVALAVSVPLGALAALLAIRALRLVARRATRRWHAPVHAGGWGMSAALAFSHGANDAQKSVGVIAALLLADGRIDTLAAPTWTKLICAVALTAGTALGGWRIIRTVGRRIYRIRPIEGLASQTASAASSSGRRSWARRYPRPRWSPPRWLGSARAKALAPRALGGGARDGSRLVHHDAVTARCRGRSRDLAAGGMTLRRWFLPDTPDVLGLLRRQVAVTI